MWVSATGLISLKATRVSFSKRSSEGISFAAILQNIQVDGLAMGTSFGPSIGDFSLVDNVSQKTSCSSPCFSCVILLQ